MQLRSIHAMAIVIVFLLPATAHATQTHGGAEGLIVHQLAHVFFAFSMGLLIYWLRKRQLTPRTGWRHIQLAALFFIAWNLDAMFSHWLLEQSNILSVENIRGTQIRITTADGLNWLGSIYYLSKLDHLLCVPAMIFLLLGLRRFYHSTTEAENHQETVP